jgi:hypothetical protein
MENSTLKVLVQDHINRYNYGIAKARYGVKVLKELDLLNEYDKVLDEQGKLI